MVSIYLPKRKTTACSFSSICVDFVYGPAVIRRGLLGALRWLQVYHGGRRVSMARLLACDRRADTPPYPVGCGEAGLRCPSTS